MCLELVVALGRGSGLRTQNWGSRRRVGEEGRAEEPGDAQERAGEAATVGSGRQRGGVGLCGDAGEWRGDFSLFIVCLD